MAITKEQMFAAADELDAAGQNPTLAAVRKAVGGGSFTTISEAMNEWRARKAAQAAPIREPAPQAVTDKLGALGADLWAVALEIANNRLASEREALEAARLDMATARQEAAELADQLTVELDEAKHRLAAVEAAEAAARGDADQVQGELAAMRERAATAEARAGELRTELDHAHQETRELRAEQHKINKAAAVQLDLVREELNQVRGELAKAEVEREAHREQRKQAAVETHRQAERLASIQGERDAARKEAAAAGKEAATLRGRVEALEILVPSGAKKPGGKGNT